MFRRTFRISSSIYKTRTYSFYCRWNICRGSIISQATATTVRIPRSLTCLSQEAGNVILPNGVGGNVRDDRDGVLAAWRECREDVTIRAVTDDELRAMGIPV